MNTEWLNILLDLSYISGTLDGISNTAGEANQDDLLNAAEQIQAIIGRIQKQLRSPLEADLDG